MTTHPEVNTCNYIYFLCITSQLNVRVARLAPNVIGRNGESV